MEIAGKIFLSHTSKWPKKTCFRESVNTAYYQKKEKWFFSAFSATLWG